MKADGRTSHPLYKTWRDIRSRCYNKNNKAYPRYAGRGITVCARWLKSFWVFLDDMGERPPGHTLDRIDNNGNYEPSNCRWATVRTQNRNRRNNWIPKLGDKYGDWEITSAEPFYKRKGDTESHICYWQVRCKCGLEKKVFAGDLLNGKSKRCRSCASKLMHKTSLRQALGKPQKRCSDS